MVQTRKRDHSIVIIGTGFGGTMTAIPLAQAFKDRGKGETILMLERGTWWTTPISTVQDKEIKTAEFLTNKGQPVQYWSAQNHFRGMLDIFSRCFRRTKNENIFTRLFKSLRNEDGLFELTLLGDKGFLGLRPKSDGVTIARASGVGGGSLVYSNITIRPPNFIFDHKDWPIKWKDGELDDYYNFARHAISYSVLSAITKNGYGPTRKPFTGWESPDATVSVNAGLSNIAARTARLKTHWSVHTDPNEPNRARGIKRMIPRPPDDDGKDLKNDLWLDRARVFQEAANQLTTDYGLVDLAINDLTPESTPLGIQHPTDPNIKLPVNYPQEKEINYCDRQGRCNVGCLPGARHTLNKQLMRASLGRPKRYIAPDAPVGTGVNDDEADFKGILIIQPLAEVDVIVPLPDGGYEVRYIQRDPQKTWRFKEKRVTADKVIVSAGCFGTNEIMLRCSGNERGTLPNLSDKVGHGFSTNGDCLALLNKTDKRASTIRGPVTTSFAHFNTEKGSGPDGPSSQVEPDTKLFHTIEDQGIPPAFASVFGEGLPLIRNLVENGDAGPSFLIHTIFRFLKKRIPQAIGQAFKNNVERADFFKGEEERISNFICLLGMGRASAQGVLRLGHGRDTPLRVSNPDNKAFSNDDIYRAIEASLKRFGKKLRANEDNHFYDPFAVTKSTPVAHPLGGCRMATSVADGVVDEFGRVFDQTKSGSTPFYEGLYIADASIIPTALGVNPSLTISALCLRIAEKIISEL